MALRALLDRLGLSAHASTFEDEELTVELLRSMHSPGSAMLHDSLLELGLSASEAHLLHDAIRSDEPAAPATRAGAGGFAERVAGLQQELFAEDLHPPPGAETWPEERLRAYFESGGEDAPPPRDEDAPPPSAPAATASDRHAPTASEPAPSVSAAGASAEARAACSVCPSCCACAAGAASAAVAVEPLPIGPIVGELPLRWQSRDYSYAYSASSTVGELRRWICFHTHIMPEKQKLVGWKSGPAPKKSYVPLALGDRRPTGGAKRTAPSEGSSSTSQAEASPPPPPAAKAQPPSPTKGPADDALIAQLSLGAKRLMVLGTPQPEIAAAELELERGRRTSRLLANDLNVKLPPPEPTQAPRRRAHDMRPIMANRGGGIYLDPEVWSVPVEQTHPERPRQATVTNPRTNRVEALELGNALLAERPPGGHGHDLRPNAPVGRPEDAPINVDLTGQPRGRCTGCDRCEGYVRQERLAENENDVEVLRCARCGCDCGMHEAIR